MLVKITEMAKYCLDAFITEVAPIVIIKLVLGVPATARIEALLYFGGGGVEKQFSFVVKLLQYVVGRLRVYIHTHPQGVVSFQLLLVEGFWPVVLVELAVVEA